MCDMNKILIFIFSKAFLYKKKIKFFKFYWEDSVFD